LTVAATKYSLWYGTPKTKDLTEKTGLRLANAILLLGFAKAGNKAEKWLGGLVTLGTIMERDEQLGRRREVLVGLGDVGSSSLGLKRVMGDMGLGVPSPE
jgi:hypothetical protein